MLLAVASRKLGKRGNWNQVRVMLKRVAWAICCVGRWTSEMPSILDKSLSTKFTKHFQPLPSFPEKTYELEPELVLLYRHNTASSRVHRRCIERPTAHGAPAQSLSAQAWTQTPPATPGARFSLSSSDCATRLVSWALKPVACRVPLALPRTSASAPTFQSPSRRRGGTPSTGFSTRCYSGQTQVPRGTMGIIILTAREEVPVLEQPW